MCIYLCPKFPFYYKVISYIALGTDATPIWLYLNINNYICNDPISKQGHILRFWEIYEFEGTLSNPVQGLCYKKLVQKTG